MRSLIPKDNTIETRVDSAQPGLFLYRKLMFVVLLFTMLLTCKLTAAYTLQSRTGNLAIYAETPVQARLMENLVKLDERIDKLQMDLGLYTDKQAVLFLVKDHKSYQQLSLGKEKIVEFSEAFYNGSEGRIYIRPPVEMKDSFTNVVMHEYIHWYLEEFFHNTPLWFHEGMATYYSGQMGFERYLYFLQQSFIGNGSDLFRMSYKYPEKQEDWPIFYLSSSMAVRFMREKKAQEWSRFMDYASQAKHRGEKAVFSEGFAFTYRNNAYDFHRQFAAYIKKLRFQYLFWGTNSLVAISLPIVVILGYFRRRRRMAAMPELPEPIDEEINTEETD